VTGRVLSACRACRSPFLRASGAGTAVCRTCGRLHVLGRSETLAAEPATPEVTTIQGHADLPPGMGLMTRATARRVCSQVVPVREVAGVLLPTSVADAVERAAG
jgi:uncharacterized Zn finger protein (UPF0148 family)